MKEIIKELKSMNIGKVEIDVPLSKHTTYKVGGVAKAFVYPKDIDSLIQVMKLLKKKNIKHMVLGNGSNTLFSDSIYEGIIIKLDELNNYYFKGTKLVAEAGSNLIKISMEAINNSLQGLEFACGIPGTVGGAVYMNAGAYKSDISEILTEVKVLTPDFKIITMKNEELNFSYRNSFFKRNKDYLILEATFKLKKSNKEDLLELAMDRKRRRLESQPLEYPSAGSVFRNPPDTFSGKLIEDLGLKGYTYGGAEISSKHANFIVNKNNAKASDIKYLIDYARDSVKKEYGIDLILEQELINWE